MVSNSDQNADVNNLDGTPSPNIEPILFTVPIDVKTYKFQISQMTEFIFGSALSTCQNII